MVGGYKIIDLGGVDLNLVGSIKGLYKKIDSTDKAIMVSNYQVSGVDKDSVYAFVSNANNTYYLILEHTDEYIGVLEVKKDDSILYNQTSIGGGGGGSAIYTSTEELKWISLSGVTFTQATKASYIYTDTETIGIKVTTSISELTANQGSRFSLVLALPKTLKYIINNETASVVANVLQNGSVIGVVKVLHIQNTVTCSLQLTTDVENAGFDITFTI